MAKKTQKTDSSSRNHSSGRFFTLPLHPVHRTVLSLRQLSDTQLAGTPANIVTIIFRGTSWFIFILLVLLCISHLVYGNGYLLPRIIAFIPIFAYLIVLDFFIHRQRFTVAAWLIIVLYGMIAAAILWTWSINAPIGILALGFVIIVAGTTLKANYIFSVTIGAVSLLLMLQLLTELGINRPDTSPLASNPAFSDVLSYGVVFGIFALITWLSRRQMEQALGRALAAEAALQKEKSLLAKRLDEQTKHLRAVQLEEMRQLYRFAEIGQLSTVLLHELANRLTVLTLDIDDIGQRHHQSEAVANARESIEYLDTLVGQVRRQLQENDEYHEFNVMETIHETTQTLQARAAAVGVNFVVTKRGKAHELYGFGDTLRLSQILTVIITNALDAYEVMETRPATPAVEIQVGTDRNMIVIRISDHAGGISAFHRSQLFTPFRSTKESGMGIGLFIARKMTETHFKGTLDLDQRTDMTTFIVRIPVYRPKQ